MNGSNLMNKAVLARALRDMADRIETAESVIVEATTHQHAMGTTVNDGTVNVYEEHWEIRLETFIRKRKDGSG